MYNTTALYETRNLSEIVIAMNDLSGGLIGVFMLAVIFIVGLVAFTKYDKDLSKVMVISSVVTAIAGTIMLGLGLINLQILIYPILLFLGSFIAYKFS